jgi:hypothetical protein
MKRTLLVVAILGSMLATGMQAQKMAIGPSLLWKAGVNAGNVEPGLKTGVNINLIPDIAATFRILLNKDESIGFTADAGYAQYTYRTRPESESVANDDNTFILKHTFFNIAPMFYISGFQIGASFGFPLAYHAVRASGASDADIATKQTSPNIELRIAGMIPVFRDKTGSVNVLVHGGYMLTGLIDKDFYMGTSDEFNPKAASFGIGVNYLFNLGD